MFIVNIHNLFSLNRESCPVQRSYHTRKAAKRAMVKARRKYANITSWTGQEKAWITEIPGRFQFTDGEDTVYILDRTEAR